jgi:hypothetical protein
VETLGRWIAENSMKNVLSVSSLRESRKLKASPKELQFKTERQFGQGSGAPNPRGSAHDFQLG